MSLAIDSGEISRFLSRISVFELLEPDHLDMLARLVMPRQLAAGQIIWLQGQNVTHFTILFSGQLRSVRRSSSGSEKLVSILTPGHHFGLAEMITGATSAVTVIAEERSIILTMNHKALRRILRSHNEIGYRFMQTMARAIFELTRELERASFENIHTRLARLLLEGPACRPPAVCHVPLTGQISHQQLAVRLGVSRETISRVLGDFKAKGLIKTGYRSISVLNRDGLMEYVEDYDQW